jgi:hypothetical protein
MFKKAFLVIAALALASTTAIAAGVGPNGATVSKDKRFTTVHQGSFHYTPSSKPPKKLKVIFDNIGFLYPKGRYFCCFGDTISGPNSQVGSTNWAATQFTPAKSGKIELINVAVGWVSGTNKIIINIAADDGGVPGTVLGTASATGLGVFGDCCDLAESNVSIDVTAGTPYWIYLSTDESNADTWAAWPFNSTDEVDPMTVAGYNGSSWTNFGSSTPALSFALYGKLKNN